MQCEHPLGRQGMYFPCGKCVPCRVNRQRMWATRIMLEATQWGENCFLTLTYDNEHYPSDGSLNPKTVQDFIKRLRRYHEPLHLRHFTVGEYGERTWRPHYHLAVFNFATCMKHQTEFDKKGEIKCCPRCADVKRIWGYGNVQLARIEPASAMYCAGYTVKKMTHRQDARLNGLHPEFARMSLRPGLGAHAMVDVASDMMQRSSTESLEISRLNTGRVSQPLGAYLTRKLRMYRGLSEKAPQEVWDRMAERLLELRLAARASAESPGVLQQYQKKFEGKFASQQGRLKLKGGKNETL